MDIRCPQCETLYEFDESRVSSGSATLKCRKCQHMFRLGDDAQPSREDQQRWMVRQPEEGDVLYFNGFDTLHRWIVEREVDRTWEISRTGDNWKTLGDVGEFRPIFQVVDNVSSLEAESGPQPGTTEKAPERSARKKKDTLEQFNQQGKRSSSGPGASANGGEAAALTSGKKSDSATDEQFSVGQEPSGSGASSASDVDESQPVSESSEPAPTPASQSGTQSPAPASQSGAQTPAAAQSGTQSPAADSRPMREPSSGSHPAQTGGAEERTRRRSPSPSPAPSLEAESSGVGNDRSNVQLDSDMFGSEPTQEVGPDDRDDPAADEWSFGDEDVGYDEKTIRDDSSVDFPAQRRRWPTVAVAAVVVAAGSIAYFFVFQREMVDRWFAAETADEAVDISETGDPGEVVDTGRTQLLQVLEAAADRARSKGIEQVAAARGEAGTVLGGAVAQAGKLAKKEADKEKKKKSSTESLLRRAQRALESGRPKQARSSFHRVIDRDPQNSEAITGLGWALLSLGKTSSAVSQFEKALHHNPSFGDAYIGLGQANQALGDSQAALDAYTKYLEKFPGGSKASIAEYQKKKIEDSLGMN